MKPHEDASRKPRARRREPEPQRVTPAPTKTIRALVVCDHDDDANSIGPTLSQQGMIVERAHYLDDAHHALARSQRRPEVIVFATSEGASFAGVVEVVRELSKQMPGVASLIVTRDPTLNDAIDAMRAGAVDLIDLGAGEPALTGATELAIERVERARQREVRLDRLRGACRDLDSVRQDITQQVSTMCTDLVDAYRELSTQIDRVSLIAEFNGIIRQELEIESLLRVSLEFLLAKIGPTNAAVFLPSSSDEFSLGAFVNYDRESESLNVMLDHLADTLAPRMEDRGDVFFGSTEEAITELMGPHAHWFDAQHVVAVSCDHEDECLAVVVMFRDKRSPLPDKALDIFDSLSHPLAQQLGRIIHCHHRHIPKDKWTSLGDERRTDEPEDDWGDLAA